MDSIKSILCEEITLACHKAGPAFGVADLDGLADSILACMGLKSISASAALTTPPRPTKPVEPVAPKREAKKKDETKKEEAKEETKKEEAKEEEAKEEEEETASTGSKKPRARTVSKKMKEQFAAMGGTEEQLAELIKKYKQATDAEIGGSFDKFARAFLGLAAPAAAPAAEKKKKAAKSERINWTPTPKKLFKEIVEGSGSAYTDDLKTEFTAYIEAKSEEDFKAISIEGHMRAFAVSKFAPAEVPKLERHAADHVEDDEDLEEFKYEEETLLIGTKSGKIYRSTEEAGDVLIGVAGQGRFADVSIPV
jgi:pyruvate/2-oxoglutarate dehydrogenase complex dihydrolipoamide acyltransferase (E2) component